MMAITRHHSWYPITDCYADNIAGNKFFSPNLGNITIPNNFCLADGIFLKGSNCLFGTTFLGNTHNCIKNQESKDLDQTSALLPKTPAGNMQKGSLTTAGSTEAVSPAPHSRKANTNDTEGDAEASNIITS